MITEFGWSPGSTQACGFTQNTTWPMNGPFRPGKDGHTHRFESDINYFLANERHKAQSVDVWIVKGWDAAADGITSTGTVLQWLHYFQWSSP